MRNAVRWGGWFGLALLLAGFAAWRLLRKPPSAAPLSRVTGSELFDEVFDKVKRSAVDPLDDQELFRRAATGVIAELDDPYAVLRLPGQPALPPEDAPAGQGLFLDRRDGLVVIVAAVPGSPADSAGVRSGDRLIAIDSSVADPSRLDRVASLLGGTAGSVVTLRVRRPGVRSTLLLTLVRGVTPAQPAVASSSLGGGVVRLRLARFPGGIADSVRTQLEALLAHGARAAVLDLRGTVGGGLAEGVSLADLFLDDGKVLAVSRARPASETASFIDHTASPFAGVPLAVLIDRGTAGAAEVVAGALQDHDRAAVLGDSSFGRGVTRSTFVLGEGVSLSLTTALWLTPNGRQIQRPPQVPAGDSLPRPTVRSDGGRILPGGGGIIPDREIPADAHGDLALAEARRVLLLAGTPAEVLALVAQKQ